MATQVADVEGTCPITGLPATFLPPDSTDGTKYKIPSLHPEVLIILSGEVARIVEGRFEVSRRFVPCLANGSMQQAIRQAIKLGATQRYRIDAELLSTYGC